MRNSLSFCIALSLALSACQVVRADLITVYDNFGSGNSGGDSWKADYDSGASVEPLGLGSPEGNEESEYTWVAAPFTPSASGTVKEIYFPIRFLHTREGTWYEDSDQYFLAIVQDENGSPFQQGVCNGLWIMTPVSSLEDDPFPVCLPTGFIDCMVQDPINPAYGIRDLNNPTTLGFDSIYLEAGQRYWLVVGIFHSVHPLAQSGLWYRNNQDDEGWLDEGTSQSIGPKVKSTSESPYYDECLNGGWQPMSNKTLPAFRIVVEGVDPCAGAVMPTTASGSCSVEPPIFTSQCWYNDINAEGNFPSSGFPLHLDLWRAFGPPDLPPRTTAPYASSLPLVSREVRHFGGPSPYRDRAMHRGLIDLATGYPLIQAIDFELPFGSAVFRHVRTYSENTMQHLLTGLFDPDDQGIEQRAADGTRWDWNGMFWSMSENPILLIDMAFKDLNHQPLMGTDSKRIYLIPDGHHSIPFRFNGTSGYEAPSWIDASISSSAEMQTVNDEAMPVRYYVSLQRNSITYTFKAVYEDVWQMSHGDSAHAPGEGAPPARPFADGGLGIPYYGLIEQIADRYGNRIVYNYCHFHQDDCPPYQTRPSFCPTCCQNCNEKGQIKSVQLVSRGDNGQDVVVWTLLYTHRQFGQIRYDTGIWQPWLKNNMLHTIHVYQGDEDVEDACLTLPVDAFCGAESLEEVDSLTHDSIPPNWVIEARYMYSEPGHDYATNWCPTIVDFRNSTARIPTASLTEEGVPLHRLIGQRLRKATVTRKSTQVGQETEDRNIAVYKDGPQGELAHSGHRNANSFLRTIYENATIQSIIEANRENPTTPVENANDIIRLDESCELDILLHSGTPEEVSVRTKLKDIADVFMNDWENPEDEIPGIPSIEDQTELSDLAGLERKRTVLDLHGRSRLVDRRPGSDGASTSIYRFVQYPVDSYFQSQQSTALLDSNEYPPRIYYHFPTQFYHPYASDVLKSTSSGIEAFFVSVIEEKRPKNKALPPGSEPDPSDVVTTRRVVKLNSAGFILEDRTYRIEGDQQELLTATGAGESYVYDAKGRIIERRSRGWASLASQENAENRQAVEGLIHVFSYEADVAPTYRGELKAEGVRQGTSGTILWLRRFYREETGRPELITRQIAFPTPTIDIDHQVGEIAIVDYSFGPSEETDPLKWPIASKVQISDGAPRTKDGDPVRGVMVEIYNENGNPEWVGAGSVDDPSDIESAVEFFWTKTTYNNQGQPTQIVVDTTESPAGNWPERPDESEVPPLELTTTHHYDPVYGLTGTDYPNGRKMRTAIVDHPNGTDLLSWTFADLEWMEGQVFKALSPVQVSHIKNGRVISVTTVALDPTDPATPGSGDTDDNPDGLGAEAAYAQDDIVSVTTPNYDGNGRISGISRNGEDGASVSASFLYDAFGQIARQRAPDGTITRNVHDEFGRLLRVYRGTSDFHEFWGTAPPICGPNQEPTTENPCTPLGEFDDNLILLEKHYYGIGVNDAFLPVGMRSYRESPLNPYFFADPEQDPPTPPTIPLNNEDRIGRYTETGYDWRMRPVWICNYKATVDDNPNPYAELPPQFGRALTHTVTWYDNLDRPRFSATYGGEGPSDGVDPRTLAPGAETPTAAQILGDEITPLSLTETIYNKRGLAEEVRTYEISSDQGQSGWPRYTSTLNYFNHLGKPVETHAPGAPMMRYLYDAKGRQFRSSTWAAGTELARSESTYGDMLSTACTCSDDSVVQTTAWERNENQLAIGSVELDETNSVRSFSHSWYDKAGRVIATANFGTNDQDDLFTTGAVPEYSPELPPVTRDSNGKVTGLNLSQLPSGSADFALVTAFAYDEAGRQAAVFHSDGTATTYEYDGLGRQIRMVENVAGDVVDRRVTLYKYDTAGRMTHIAGGDGNYADVAYDQIDFEAGGPGLQVTRIAYGGTVLGGEEHPTFSANNGLIASVHFPDPATGAPAELESLSFAYTFDGMVKWRTDEAGNWFAYDYDDFGRLVELNVTHAPLYADAGLEPPDRTNRILYDYTDDGRLESATAFGESVPSNWPLSNVSYEYDARGNLLKEWQAIGHVQGVATPHVEYVREYSPLVGGNNVDVLSMMRYPFSDSPGGSLQLWYTYDTAVDSQLGRVRGISETEFSNLARYWYWGVSRRVQSGLTSLIDDYLSESNVVSAFDRFGRIRDLYFTGDRTDEFLFGESYGYDKMGNRTLVHHASPYGPGDDFAYEHAYDGLQRLVQTDFGPSPEGEEIETITDSIAWNLDALGNWSGGPIVDPGQPDPASVARTGEFFGEFDLHHAVDSANRIGELVQDGQPVAEFVYDKNRNLRHDGRYLYDYDAWGRLIQVRDADGTVSFDGDLVTLGTDNGPLCIQYAYDAVGRLMRKRVVADFAFTGEGDGSCEAAVPGCATLACGCDACEGLEAPCMRCGANPAVIRYTDHYYYDGVRRIQEVRTVGGDPSRLAGGLGESVVDDQTTVINSQYIYGPDYVDELIAEVPRDSGYPVLIFQDANYNVAGVMDWSDPYQFAQYYYDPYGNLLAGGGLIKTSVGHQGLFFDRFTGDPGVHVMQNFADDLERFENAQGEIDKPVSFGVYQNRNRVYSPVLGRFLQRDPNETALPLLTAMASNGSAISVLVSDFQAMSLYGDGANLYGYESSNPVSRRDPAGLEDDFESMIADLNGQRVATLGYIHDATGWAILGTTMAVNVAGEILGITDLYKLGKDAMSGQLGFWDFVKGAALVATPAAAEYAIRGAMKAFRWGRNYMKYGRMSRNSDMLAKVGCFVAGTMISMANGEHRAIEDILPGDFVACDADPAMGNGPENSRVARVTRRMVNEVVDLTLESDGERFTITATSEHPFYVAATDGYVETGRIRPGVCLQSIDGDAIEVVSNAVRLEPTKVYNFEVEGSHNYYVANTTGEASVLVHNNPCANLFKPFTQAHFRDNMGILWKVDPPPGYIAHHMFATKYERQFRTLKIDIHNPRWGAWWPHGDHTRHNIAYNDAWGQFFAQGKRTTDEAMEFGRELARRYGLDIAF